MNRTKETKKRAQRNRFKLSQVNKTKRPRLSIYRSCKHISAQIIDDEKGVTVAFASSIDKDIRGKKVTKSEKAKEVGDIIAQKAKDAGVKKVVFDRGGFPFHGRVKVLAQAARDGGIEF